jgi:hypothetical protein
MDRRIVESTTAARQGTKQVSCYVLLASPVLVVVLFQVAYDLFS